MKHSRTESKGTNVASKALRLSGFFAKLAIASLTIAVLLVVASLTAFYLVSQPPESFTVPVVFTVSDGETGQGVSRRLETSQLIKSALLMDILLHFPGAKTGFKSGTYRLEGGMNTQEIFEMLVQGKQLLERITIPEGWTMSRIAAALEEKKIASKKDFLSACSDKTLLGEFGITAASCEGYLFPDTYLIPLGYPAKDTVRLMLSGFFSVLGEICPESNAMNALEIRERLIIASIVEREYRVREEAPRMAGVFFNRLKLKMPLQSCATVVYVITERLGKKHPDQLYFRDLEIKDPFNTYLNAGLPPGPISNPGKNSLSAAFNPENTQYLYFRLIDEASGKHVFSMTLDAHLRAHTLSVKK